MSEKLLNHNPILQKFVGEGFSITIKKPFLILNDIPYVTKDKTISYGKIVSQLVLSGDTVVKPNIHVVYFCGEFPCDQYGELITKISHQTVNRSLSDSIFVNYSFSNRNDNSYDDEYEKIINYVNIITGPVHLIDKSATPYTNKLPEVEIDDDSYVFNFFDTNASRGNFTNISNKLSGLNIGIIGLGGTGSYILDMVAKTPVKSIHLFDNDKFNSHNAFRAPGSPTIDQLNMNIYKVEYFKYIYSKMHKHIFSINQKINKNNIQLLENIDFIFINIDASEEKKDIIEYLTSKNIPFIDSGIDVEIFENSLTSTIRNTFVHKETSERWEKIISYEGKNIQYESNIQIAELNNLAAIFSIIKWKKYYGVYHNDLAYDYTYFIVEGEELINEN